MSKITRRDAMKRGGKAVAAAATPPDPGDLAPSDEPDAMLLRTDACYTAFLAECNAGKHSVDGDVVSDLAFQSLTALEEAVAASPVRTLAGIAARLRGVKAFIWSSCPVGWPRRCPYIDLERVDSYVLW